MDENSEGENSWGKMAKKDPRVAEKYERLIAHIKPMTNPADLLVIDQAFQLASSKHEKEQRQSGEPYLIHLLQVALIVALELGLGPICIAASLLHHITQTPGVTIASLEQQFGRQIAGIVEGISKIQKSFSTPFSARVANFRHLMEKSAYDHRIILLKIADRLDNMRSLELLPEADRMRIASETMAIFVPITHRLGASKIRMEMEDICFKQLHRSTYLRIERQMTDSQEERELILKEFTLPIEETLARQGISFRIKKRLKSMASIWKKMEKQHISLNQIYDLIAIRIIIDCPLEQESLFCWQAYALVTSLYKPHPSRLRDWLTMPRSNGYESLHITVMSDMGRWVEVQIRTERMHRIASRGVAAHWKYKEDAPEEGNPQLDLWIEELVKLLEEDKHNSIADLQEVSISLHRDEVNVFTQQGVCKVLPRGASILDFVVATQGEQAFFCSGALVDRKILTVETPLHNGAQIRPIIQSEKMITHSWLSYVVTPKARELFKRYFSQEALRLEVLGEQRVKACFERVGRLFDRSAAHGLQELFGASSLPNLYRKVGQGTIPLGDVTHLIGVLLDRLKGARPLSKLPGEDVPALPISCGQHEMYTFASCCAPLPGEAVVGLQEEGGLLVHLVDCSEVQERLALAVKPPVKLRWEYDRPCHARLRLVTIDTPGMLPSLLDKIEGSHRIQSLRLGKEANRLTVEITLWIQKAAELQELSDELGMLPGVFEAKYMRLTIERQKKAQLL